MLSQSLVPGTTLRGAAPRELFAYWQEKRRGRLFPAWSDIQLMDLWRIAAHLSVKDVIDDGSDFRNRYWGSQLTLAFDVEGTGKTPDEVLGGPDHRESAVVNFRRVVETAMPVLSYRRITFMDQREHVAFEAVHLPLGAAVGGVRHIISAYEFELDLSDLLRP